MQDKHLIPIYYVTPFSDEIMASSFPQSFKMSNLIVYNEKDDLKMIVNLFNI